MTQFLSQFIVNVINFDHLRSLNICQRLKKQNFDLRYSWIRQIFNEKYNEQMNAYFDKVRDYLLELDY